MMILIIEDEKQVSEHLVSTLVTQGYQTTVAEKGSLGVRRAIEVRPELIILDLGLPDRSGLSVLKEIRTWSTVPIIILTAIDSDETKVEALDSGADDYLTKPFSAIELLARVRVSLRHARPHASSKLSYQEIELDLDGHRTFVNQQPVKLTSTEFEILKVLMLSAGKVVTHRALLRRVWGPNSVEHTQYLRLYVGYLRKKLSAISDKSYIINEPGIGYRLVD